MRYFTTVKLVINARLNCLSPPCVYWRPAFIFIQDPAFMYPPPLETPASIKDQTFIVTANAVVFVVSSSLILFFSVFFSLTFIVVY